jgi:SAM-dependent methyltransferase
VFVSIVQRYRELFQRTEEPRAQAGQPFGARLRAWWEGAEPLSEPDTILANVAVSEASESVKPDVLPPSSEWAEDRIALMERLWGEDFISPGDLNYVLDLIKPIGINPSMHVLNLGAQIGGATRGVAQRWGAWVVGLVSSAELADVAQKRSYARGLGGKAQIKHYDPESAALRPNTFNCAYAREAFFTVRGKARLFRSVAAALKPSGQFMFTDYVVSDPQAEGARAWMALEPVAPHVWTADRTMDCLQKAGFSIWFNDDLTEQHQGQILQGWSKLVSGLAPGSLPRSAVGPLVDEVALWARRIAAIQSGALKLFRFYCVKA